MELSFELSDIKNNALIFQQTTKGYKIFAFHGNLGSGKTTFIKNLCELLHCEDVASSPTYSIINEYTLSDASLVYHIDAYRINSEREAVEAGIEDCIYSNYLCFIEWPEKIEHLIPKDAVHVYFEVISNNKRKIKIELPLRNH